MPLPGGLRVKAVQHDTTFGALLTATGDRPIVEESRRDDFWWGAKPTAGDLLEGRNVLGRLLMELRQELAEPVCACSPSNLPASRTLSC